MLRGALIFLLLVLVAGCSPRTPTPPTADSPRIVVLSPALAVVLTDLGMADRVVGRHAYDAVLDPAVPVCGEQQAINYEALLRARPTHVLTQWGSRELPAKLTKMGEREGFVVRDFRVRTLAEIEAASNDLRQMFAGATPGETLARFDRLVSGPTPEPVWEGRVLLLMGVSPIMALGPGSAHQELLDRCGGVPAIAEGSPSMTLHAEDVLRLAPDAIVLIRSGDGEGGEDEADDHAVFGAAILGLDIPAVTAGRLAVIEHPLALLPSPRLVEVGDALREMLERWATEE